MLVNAIEEIVKIFQSNHPFMAMLREIYDCIICIWNYSIFETDKHPITVSNIILGIILFTIGLRIAKALSIIIHNKLAQNTKLNKHDASSLERIIYYFFVIVITFLVLEITNVPLTALTVIGTTFALGVGLGSQNIANNFISGLIIMVERPIKIGDIIEIKNIVGKVTNIGARCVNLQTENNINMLIPNSNILQDNVINWTHNDTILKIDLPFKIGNTVPIEMAEQSLLKLLNSTEYVLKEPSPKINLTKLGENSLTFEIGFWINLDTGLEKKDIINYLNREISAVCNKNNIKILDIDSS